MEAVLPESERPPLKPLVPASWPEQVPDRLLVSSVTAPVLARALPQRSVALVFMVILVFARILPMKVVLTAMVAELPTFQYTPAPEPVLITFTTELLDVISVLGIWKTQAALALPPPSSVSVPDRLVVPAATV